MACLAVGGVAWADTRVVFSKDEAAVIQGYYAQHPADVGQGKSQGQKGKPLPPGIAMAGVPATCGDATGQVAKNPTAFADPPRSIRNVGLDQACQRFTELPFQSP